MGKQHSLAEIASLLRGLKRIIVLSHYNPDPDAYGSSCGLTLALRGLGKDVVCINESGILDRLLWIPGVNAVQNSFPAGDWEAVVACDCGDGARVGDTFKEKVLGFPLLVNIDHHASNDFFGHYNYVKPDACSTSEIICDLIEELKAPWSADIATCLYAGISGDTGSFKYSSTTAKTFDMCQRLVQHGASPVAVAQNLYARNSLASVKLHAEALSSMKLQEHNRVASIAVTADMLARHAAQKEDADPLVEIARDIDGVVVAILFKQDADLWRISLRAKDARVDVSKIAGLFGGGGHKAAAGFRWKRSFAELEQKLMGEISKALGAL
ncbi:MAG: bifunctional oligoribonuclease/PAP phosphatase NrnA [Deltaproteobacteria bacterium]|nr:bifunctional oligoribonuclease/PAP phosphatase NrnA [Deltaproteobacteria bacterium]